VSGCDLRAIDGHFFDRPRLREKRFNGCGPISRQEIRASDMPAPQVARHFDEHDLVFREMPT
jgi:hypothetical protein